jgi:hypothetical protein
MIRRLTTNRRLLLLGAAAALLLAVVVFRSADRFAVDDGEDALAVKQDQLSRYDEKLRSRERIEARLAVSQRQLARLEKGLLQAKTASLAAVDIQQLLTQIAGTTQAEIKTMRILGPEQRADAPYTAVTVQVTLLSSLRQLVGVLHAIDTSEKLLRTRDLSIRSAGVRQNHQVLTTMTVEGFMKREGA